MIELIIGAGSVAIGLLFWARARWAVAEWDRGWSKAKRELLSRPEDVRRIGYSRPFCDGYEREFEVDPSDRFKLPLVDWMALSSSNFGKQKPDA